MNAPGREGEGSRMAAGPGLGLRLRSLPGRIRGSVLAKIVWPLAVALAIGGVVTAIFAVRMAGRHGPTPLSGLELALLSVILVGAAAALLWRTVRSVTKPLGTLARTARQVAGGNLEAHFAQTSNDEIGQLASALEIMKLELRSQLDLIGSQAEALRESSKRLATIRDEERRRLARDLHDGLQQQLVVLRMGLGMAPDRIRTDPAHARETLKELGGELDRAIERVREVSHDLYPSILRDAGLTSALRSQAGRLPITAHVTSDPDPLPRLAREIESSAYFILSEAVANVLKHSEATEVAMALTIEKDRIALTITDNGRGFQRDPDAEEAPAGGLTHMDDRVRSLGGELFVTSGETGTTIRASLPLHPERVGMRGAGDGPVEQLLAESARSGTFVGRESEIDRLRAAFEKAASGRGRVVLLVGEAGIGKTRTANELATYAASRGAEVLVGRCYEGGGAPAYWPWIQVMRTYVRRRDPAELAEEMGPGAEDIAQMDPELARRLAGVIPPEPKTPPEGAEPAAPDPRQARFRLFDSIASFLRTASATRPIVIVLDDLQSADTPSLLLLGFLSNEVAASRLLLVGTHRDVPLPAGHPLGTTLSGLELGQASETIPLSGLDEGDVARFMEIATGAPPPEPLVSAVYRQTEGNPLFVREVVRLLASEGHLEQPEEGPREGTEATVAWGLDIPVTVRDAIGRRLDHLSPGCNDALSVASAIGREFDLAVLQPAAAMAPDRLAAALEEAAAARVLVELPDMGHRSRTFRFNHTLMRETIYGQLPEKRRLRLHRRIAQVMEGIHTGDPDARLAELAHQYQEAARGQTRGRDREKAIYYATWAGERAASVLAFEEAAGHYGRALESLGGDVGTKANEPRRCDLLLALGETQWRAGDTPPARRSFAQAAAIARRLRDPSRLARAAVGYGEGLGAFEFAEGADDVLVGLLEEALDALEQWPLRSPGRLQRQVAAAPETPEVAASRLKVRVLSRLAVELYYTDQVERRAALGQQAVELAQRLGDPRTQLVALFSRFRSVLGPDALDERLAAAAEIERLAEEIADREMAFRGRHFRLLTLLETGDRRAVDAGLEGWSDLATELRQPLYRWQVLSFRTMMALLDGRYGDADATMREALLISRQGPGQAAMIRFGAQLFLHHWGRGLLAEMEPTARDLAGSYPWLPGWRTGLAVIYAELDRLAEARSHFEEVAAVDFADLPRDGNWLGSIALSSIVCHALRDVQRASVLFELLSPYEDRCIVVHAGGFCLGSAATFLGILAGTLGRFDEAQRLFDAGLRGNEALGAGPMIALTLTQHAAMLTSRNGPGDAHAAIDLLARAVTLGHELGMRHALEVAQELEGRAGSLVRVSASLRLSGVAAGGPAAGGGVPVSPVPVSPVPVSPGSAGGRTAPPPPAG
jgi:signal transduction histidine kinase/tetratricopeptide (TPR) repeat protein